MTARPLMHIFVPFVTLLVVLSLVACNDTDEPPETVATVEPTPTEDQAEPTSTPEPAATPTPESDATPEEETTIDDYYGAAPAASSPTPDDDGVVEEPTDEDTGDVEIAILNFEFDPPVVTIPAGTTVTWTNEGSVGHTTTSADELWDSELLQQGDSFSFTFEEPGEYDYFCNPHPHMTAQIIVE